MKNKDQKKYSELLNEYVRCKIKADKWRIKEEEAFSDLSSFLENKNIYETEEVRYTPSRQGKPARKLDLDLVKRDLGVENLDDYYKPGKVRLYKPKIVLK